jgi:hypothetical protein
MRGIIRGGAVAGLLAAVLAAGCSAGTPGPYHATADTCYAFGVRALQQHVTVAAVPRACAGLSHAQVNLAIAKAVRDVTGSRPKAAARRQGYEESGYLARLISAVPLPAPVRLAMTPARRSTDSPLSLAALAAWIVTAAAGSYLLAGFLAYGGPRRHTQAASLPAALVVSHVAPAVAGLGIWIAFVAAGVPVLAWTAVGVLLPAAGLGMATLVNTLPGPAPGAAPPDPGGPPTAPIAATAAPARMRPPVTVIAVHGVLAMAVVLLVLLAAIGAA